MKTAVVTAKIDPKIKASALKAARDLGVSLSFVISDSLRKFAEKKTMELIPTQETIDAIRESRKEVAEGNVGPVFTNPEDFIKSLKNLPD